MEIRFKDKKIREICEKQVKAIKILGDIGARKLQARLSDLEAASRVTDLLTGNPHPLTGDRLGQFSLTIHGGVRLVFESANNPIPKKYDNAIDWSLVTIVSIEFIGDYHD